MKSETTVKKNRQYISSTGKLGVWIPIMEPSAQAGQFYQPNSGWTWCGAELYVLPSGKLVHVQGNWSAISGDRDTQTVTVFRTADDALKAANKTYDEDEFRPAYLAELLQKSGITDLLPTLE